MTRATRRTRRPTRLASRALALLLFAGVVPAFAAAPTDQYVPFNRDDIIIVDQNTGLQWTRASAGPVSQSAAASACAGKSARLPSLTELETIVDENVHREYDFATGKVVEKAIDVNAFPDTPAALFWTASPVAGGANYWAVDFGTGETNTLPVSTPLAYRCVTP